MGDSQPPIYSVYSIYLKKLVAGALCSIPANFHFLQCTHIQCFHLWDIFQCLLSFILVEYASLVAPGADTPDSPPTFPSCQLYFQAFPLPAFPAVQQDIQKTPFFFFFFGHILKNECFISLACQASPGPLPAIPTPTLQGTFPCSRLRSCSHASNASLTKMNCKGHGSCSSFC